MNRRGEPCRRARGDRRRDGRQRPRHLNGRATLSGSDTIAGSVIALDTAVPNVISARLSLTDAVAAASRNPARLIGLADRGRIEIGLRADLVELDDQLSVLGTWIGGRRI